MYAHMQLDNFDYHLEVEANIFCIINYTFFSAVSFIDMDSQLIETNEPNTHKYFLVCIDSVYS
jgi:hypothetical protein